MKFSTSKLTLSAMFVALGILVPIVFHAVGLGSIFLPMFWPLAVAAFFLPPSHAFAVGFITPIVSSLLTGMPPVSPPILYLMMIELALMTWCMSFFYTRLKLGVLFSVILGVILERFALYLMAVPFASLIGLPPKIASTAWVLKGLPGAILIILLVPFLVSRIKHEPFLRK